MSKRYLVTITNNFTGELHKRGCIGFYEILNFNLNDTFYKVYFERKREERQYNKKFDKMFDDKEIDFDKISIVL